MTSQYILSFDDPAATLELTGGKGSSLARMARAGIPVPGGFHITTETYLKFVSLHYLQPSIQKAISNIDHRKIETLDAASELIVRLFTDNPIPDELSEPIQKAYSEMPGLNPAVAVRSSATVEDLPEASFAGQQETYLNVIGPEGLLEAVRKCWASLWTARAISYRSLQGITSDGAALAVVVQTLVDAEASGVLFTANPINGRRDQIVLNTSWGLGEAIVGGLVTPDTITVSKSTMQTTSYEIADKQIQTVRVESGTAEKPVPNHLRRAQVLSEDQAVNLAKIGIQIEDLFEHYVDIEWVMAKNKFAIVQARPITALPDEEPSTPTEWKLPEGAYAAMRNNIVELMTDPLTPLFKTLGLKAVNTSMDRTMTNFLGTSGVLPDDPIIVVNEYAYYNGSVRFGPMLKIILDTRGLIRRMFTGAVERWTEESRPKYIDTVHNWEAQPWESLPSIEILAAVRQLAEAAIDAYMALVSGVIPAAWISEAWFTWRYKFMKVKGGPEAPVFLMGFNSLPIQAEKALFDLATWVRMDEKLSGHINDSPAKEIVNQFGQDSTYQGLDGEIWLRWQKRVQEYLTNYGHMIYNLDFGNPTPADDPTPIIETLKMFVGGQGVNPHERQQESTEKRMAAVETLESGLKRRRLKSFQKILMRAQKYAPLREDGLAEVGLSYPLIRKMLREIGSRFVQAGMIEQIDDVFWLIEEEVEVSAGKLDAGKIVEPLSTIIPQRKAIWRSARKASPPMMLPQIKIFGKDLMAIKTGGIKKEKKGTLKGVAASPGTITAPACVMHGPEDFSKMTTGDVLVASLTTPAWTPLFARASAVVTDIGGPLSHGSIVAREYGIPAVLGTGSATAQIENGQLIYVDGSNGIVELIMQED